MRDSRRGLLKLSVLMTALHAAPAVAQEQWLQLPSPTTANVLAVAFPDSATGYMVGEGGIIYKTTNAAGSWTAQISGVSQSLRAVRFTSTTHGVAVGTQGVILRTTNGGASWVPRSSGTIRDLNGLFFGSASVGYAVGDTGTILKTTDGGASWSTQSSGTTKHLNALYMLDPNRGFIVGEATFNSSGAPATFLKTTDGDTWIEGTGPTLSTAYDVFATDSNTLFAVDYNYAVHKSTNGGDSWQGGTLPLNLISAYGRILFLNSDVGYASFAGGGIAKTTNAGASWVLQPIPSGATIRGMAFTDINTGYAVADGGKIFKHVYTPPATPALSLPTDALTDAPLSLNLVWGLVPHTSTYRVQVATDAAFATVVHEDSTLLSATTYLENLSTSTTYYWRVRAKNPGGTSEWSATRSFTTVPPIPPAPNLSSPVSGATDQAVLPTLTWAAASGAVSYRVQVSTSPVFATLVKDTVQAGTSKAIGPELANNTLHYWRVSATNAGGTSAYSTVSTFTTVPVPAAPAPSDPALGAVNVSLTPTLSWSASAHALSYRVQLSTDPAFGSFVLNDSGVTGASRAAGTLNPSTTYYWRVNAKNGGTSAFSATMSFTTLPPQPGMPALATPTASAVDIPLSTTLTWNASSNAVTYRAQLATDATFATIVSEDSTLTGTSFPVGPLTPGGVYHWRVNSKNPAGTSAWSTARSFTVVPPIPGAPTPTAPANNAGSVAVSGDFAWTAPSGAASYMLQLSRNAGFTDLVSADSGITTTTRAYSGLRYGAAYYWRVRAKNAGGSGAFSAASMFTTAALGVPVPTGPAHNAVGVPLSSSLTWNAVTSATTYHVQFSTDSLFVTTTVNDTAVASASRAFGPLTPGVTYFWRVRTRNLTGSETSYGDWMAAQRFTALAVPTAPALASPGADSTQVPVSPNLVWQSSSGAATYRVQLAADTLFTNLLLDDSTLTATTRAAGPLSHATVHYWRVNAKNAAGTSLWSAWRKFTTAAVGAPTLVSPAANATGLPVSTTLSWNAVAVATGYTLQVSTDSAFAVTTVHETLAAVTTRAIGPLVANATYYWRLRAQNGASLGAWSETRKFTTLAAPAIPVLVAPAVDSMNAPLAVTLAWQASAGAETYRVQLSADSTFATFLVNDSAVTSLSRAAGTLANGVTYYWRVSAKNGGGTSGFSPVRRFKTVSVTGLALARLDRGPAAAGYLAFDLATSERVRIGLIDAKGARVMKVLDARLPAGAHQVPLPRRASETGYYFLEFKAGDYRRILKLSALR